MTLTEEMTEKFSLIVKGGREKAVEMLGGKVITRKETDENGNIYYYYTDENGDEDYIFYDNARAEHVLNPEKYHDDTPS
jgi:hypothetical protein